MAIRRSLLGKADLAAVLSEAVAAINAGRLILLPVTSGYVLACDAHNASAISDLDIARHNDKDYVSSMIFPTVEAMNDEVTLPILGPGLLELIESGSLTLIVNKDTSMRSNQEDSHELVAVNIPINPWVRKLLKKTGPCAVGAASIIGEGVPKRLTEVSPAIKDLAEVAIDAGIIKSTVSTVINFAGTKPILIRVGAVSEVQIKKLIPDL